MADVIMKIEEMGEKEPDSSQSLPGDTQIPYGSAPPASPEPDKV